MTLDVLHDPRQDGAGRDRADLSSGCERGFTRGARRSV